MPGAAQDALLHLPRVRANLQHIQIVIGFEHQAIRSAQMYFHQLRHIAQVSNDGHLCAVRAERKADGIGGVVWNRKRVHVNVADGEMLARLDGFNAPQPLPQCFRQDALHRIHGRLRNVERRFPNAKHLRQAVAVVGVFVSDQDAVNVLDGSFNSCKAGKRFAFAQSGVHEESGSPGLEQRDVARAARRQDGNPQRDRSPLGKFLQHKKILSAPNQILKMMAERRTRVNRDYAIATMIYSRGKPWKSTISSWLVPAQGASVPRFKRRSLASAPRSSKSWK